MNEPLALAARKAIRDPAFVSEPGCCQRFVREVLEKVYGDRYDDYRADSALHAAEKWREGGYAFPPEEYADYPQIGDVLYKTHGSGGFGHVGIYVGRLGDATEGLVAENSSTTIGRIQGAKGYRPLSAFGPVDMVVRLAPPAPSHSSV